MVFTISMSWCPSNVAWCRSEPCVGTAKQPVCALLLESVSAKKIPFVEVFIQLESKTAGEPLYLAVMAAPQQRNEMLLGGPAQMQWRHRL
jgi:hypothetical protein